MHNRIIDVNQIISCIIDIDKKCLGKKKFELSNCLEKILKIKIDNV